MQMKSTTWCFYGPRVLWKVREMAVVRMGRSRKMKFMRLPVMERRLRSNMNVSVVLIANRSWNSSNGGHCDAFKARNWQKMCKWQQYSSSKIFVLKMIVRWLFLTFKLAILTGFLKFFLFGSETNLRYIPVRQPIWDAKLPNT